LQIEIIHLQIRKNTVIKKIIYENNFQDHFFKHLTKQLNNKQR